MRNSLLKTFLMHEVFNSNRDLKQDRMSTKKNAQDLFTKYIQRMPKPMQQQMLVLQFLLADQ